jgi:hypothetical protein
VLRSSAVRPARTLRMVRDPAAPHGPPRHRTSARPVRRIGHHLSGHYDSRRGELGRSVLRDSLGPQLFRLGQRSQRGSNRTLARSLRACHRRGVGYLAEASRTRRWTDWSLVSMENESTRCARAPLKWPPSARRGWTSGRGVIATTGPDREQSHPIETAID